MEVYKQGDKVPEPAKTPEEVYGEGYNSLKDPTPLVPKKKRPTTKIRAGTAKAAIESEPGPEVEPDPGEDQKETPSGLQTQSIFDPLHVSPYSIERLAEDIFVAFIRAGRGGSDKEHVWESFRLSELFYEEVEARRRREIDGSR